MHANEVIWYGEKGIRKEVATAARIEFFLGCGEKRSGHSSC